MEALKRHQELLHAFHAKAHILQEDNAAKQKVQESSLLFQKEETTAAVAQEETGKRLMLAAEANQILRTTSKLFKRSLKRWEKAEKDIISLLLRDAKGPTLLQDGAVKSAAHRAQTAQLE